MKSFDAPSSVSTTHTTESADSSPTALLPAIGPDSIATLTDTETLRVLEVRRPTQNAESTNERDSYEVRIEERVQQQRTAQPQRPALALVPSKPRVLPPPGAFNSQPAAAPAAAPVKPAAAPAAKPAAPRARALTAELDKLTAKDYEPELADLSSTTGVRHLRIELLHKKADKPTGGKKR